MSKEAVVAQPLLIGGVKFEVVPDDFVLSSLTQLPHFTATTKRIGNVMVKISLLDGIESTPEMVAPVFHSDAACEAVRIWLLNQGYDTAGLNHHLKGQRFWFTEGQTFRMGQINSEQSKIFASMRITPDTTIRLYRRFGGVADVFLSSGVIGEWSQGTTKGIFVFDVKLGLNAVERVSFPSTVLDMELAEEFAYRWPSFAPVTFRTFNKKEVQELVMSAVKNRKKTNSI